jgi:hypothetical protein
MRQWTWWIINGVLLCAVGLGGYLHSTLDVSGPPAARAPEPAPLETVLAGGMRQAPSGAVGPLWRVAYLLGHRPIPPSATGAPSGGAGGPPPSTGESAPLVVEWLSYVGVVTTADGTQLWYFKDSRSGRVIRPQEGEGGSSWILEEQRDDGFILSRDGVRYWVVR